MDQQPDKRTDENINVHIFNTSAQLVGVCLTVIGIMAVIVKLKDVSTVADDMVALNAGFFLGSCGLSYLALRTKKAKRRCVYEKAADIVFLVALFFMGVVCAAVALELIKWY